MSKGILYAILAYVFWGLHPIYWKQLANVSATEILGNRIIWSFLFFSVIAIFYGKVGGIYQKFISSSQKKLLIIPTFLIGSNWLTYIWAINNGFIMETSLGYFISPIFSVILGVIFLKEKLNYFQWVSVFLALSGVLVFVFLYGQVPWVSLYLAFSWSIYGLLRKKSPFDSVEGFFVETLVMFLPALIYITLFIPAGESMFFSTPETTLLLIGTGLISSLPLLIFVKAVKDVKLSLIGVLQYIYPTLIFLEGLLLYNEPLGIIKLSGFILIWIALMIYSVSSFYPAKFERIVK